MAERRPALGMVALDANVIGADVLDADVLDGAAVDPRVRRLLHLIETGALRILVSDSVAREFDHPKTPRSLRALATRWAQPAPHALNAAQHIGRIRVRAVLRGNADTAKHEADALHLSEADEAGCACFITRDRRILRKRADLEASFGSGMRVMGPAEFLALYDDTGTGDPPEGATG